MEKAVRGDSFLPAAGNDLAMHFVSGLTSGGAVDFSIEEFSAAGLRHKGPRIAQAHSIDEAFADQLKRRSIVRQLVRRWLKSARW
jgi:hypothetical protein